MIKVGDLVTFRFTFELPNGKFIDRGDIGIVKEDDVVTIHVLHMKSGEIFKTRRSSVTKLEIQ